MQNKHSFILIIFIVAGQFIPLNCFAQNQTLNSKLTVSYNQQELIYVLEDLSERTGLEFSYSSNVIPINEKVSYKAKQEKLDVILADILHKVGVHYKLIDNFFVLRPLTIVEKEEIAKIEAEKRYTISGFVRDKLSGELLIGTAIVDSLSGIGTTTNNYGFFSLTLKKGTYNLHTSYLGYELIRKKIELNKNVNWNIVLPPQISMVDEVVVSSIDREEEILSSLSAEYHISPLEVKKQTPALGESDLLKSFDNLPGISFQGDGSSYFFVRGGNRDQNMILLDEAPLYNPTHLLGLFTPIIPDVIKSTSIYKGDFPIEYGGRLSSLIDIRTRDGNMEKFGGSATIGLVSTRLSIEGPFKKEVASYFVSFRRSHFGMLAKGVQDNIKDFFFSDFTAKFNTKIGKKDRLFVTLYNGQDKFITGDNLSTSGGLAWGNSSFTVRWNHVFGDRLFANTTFYTSQYDYNLYTNYYIDERWNSHISSAHLKSDFTYYLDVDTKLKFGAKAGSFFINPGNHNGSNIADVNTVSSTNSFSFLAYAGLEQKFTEKFIVNAGLRLVHWSNYGEAFVINYNDKIPVDVSNYKKGEKYYGNFNVEPRIAFSYKVSDFTRLGLSYNRTLQHIHLINNSISPYNSLEVWLPSGPNIKPQKADIYNLSLVKNMPAWKTHFSVDVFYKKLYNQVVLSNHANTLLNVYLEGEINQGDGKAYGFEFLAKKDLGKFSGQLGYSFTRSLLKVAGINEGIQFKARQDKPIDFSVGLNYQLKPRWQATLNFLYSSGLRITTPTSYYYYRGNNVPIYGRQNNDKLPDYKRLDIASRFKLDKTEGGFNHFLSVSIYNLLNFRNPNFLYFNKVENNNGEYVVPVDQLNNQEQITTMRYLYSVVPSISYSLNF